MLLPIFFWIFYVLAVIFGCLAWWPTSRQSAGAWLLLLICLFLMGIRLFPVPLH